MEPLQLTISDWKHEIDLTLQAKSLNALENGQVLFFPKLDFIFQAEEKKFLSATCAKNGRKNVSYNSKNDRLKGTSCKQEDYNRLKKLLARYAQTSTDFLRRLLPHYAEHLEQGRTSYRPVQIQGRPSSIRKDDTRLHVDAFPATPNQGKRILRIFTNVNPHEEPRVWRLGEPFPQVAARFANQLPPYRPWIAKILKLSKSTKSLRTAYDHYMLHIHDQMKSDNDYQRYVSQIEVNFPPQSTWIVFTDQVSHAAMSGQFAFEQTFYLPPERLLNQDLAPINVLAKQIKCWVSLHSTQPTSFNLNA
jgi:hypothetical protein